MTDEPHTRATARGEDDAQLGISRRDLVRTGATGALSVGTVADSIIPGELYHKTHLSNPHVSWAFVAPS
jgi:hypothetical protein